MVVLIVIVNCPTCNSRQYHTEIQIHEYKIHQANLVPVQGEGDDRSLTDTLPEDSVSVTGSEMNTPNTIRKGEICLLFCSVKTLWRVSFFFCFFLMKQMNDLDTIRKTEFFSPIWVKGVWLFTLLAFRRHYRDASGVHTRGSIAP